MGLFHNIRDHIVEWEVCFLMEEEELGYIVDVLTNI